MKKYILIVAVIMLCGALLPVSAFAQTKTEKEIKAFVEAKDKILQAECIVEEDCCILAIKTEKFTGRKDYIAFVEETKQQLTERFRLENVIVTRSPKVMHAIKKIGELTEQERQQEFEKILEMLPHKPQVLPEIQPK